MATQALRVALKQLGFQDTYHMLSASTENPLDCLLWSEALAAKYDGTGERFGRAKWDALLGHCQAVCDWPAASFADELIEAYPDAKVVLTTRDVDSWYKPTKATVNWRAQHDYMLWALSYVDWGASLYYPMVSKYWNSVFMGDFDRHGKSVFASHNERIRKLIPADRLLEFRLEDGWEPLCKFLGCPVPSTPFPHVNEGGSFLRRVKRRNLCQLFNVLFRWFVWAVAGLGLYFLMKSSMTVLE